MSSSSLTKVTFGKDLPGLEAGDKASPAVVVVQEWWGIDDDIKDQALYLASKGYRVLIPDLYKGTTTVHKEEAQHLMSNLDFPNAVQELKMAAEYLRSTGSPKVGGIGFCMGGALVTAAAEHAGLDAAAPFYGIPPPPICTPGNITVPVQGHFGRLDKMKGFSDAETAEAYYKQIKHGQLHIYENCDHGFMNDIVRGESKRKELNLATPSASDQQLAWDRVLALFKDTLST